MANSSGAANVFLFFLKLSLSLSLALSRISEGEGGAHPGILRGGNLHGSRGQGAAKYKYCDFNSGSAAGSQLRYQRREELAE